MRNWIGLIVISVILSGCEGYFGKKTDTDFIEVPNYEARQIAYVPIQPALTFFDRPVDVIAGFDELIYVVDAGTETVHSLDESGRKLQSINIPGARFVSQSRNLDLWVGGTTKDTVNGVEYDLSCVYHLDLNGTGGYGLANAIFVDTIVHPFYLKSSFSASDAEVILEDIAFMDDNRFYLARSGPDNNPSKFGGPDDAVLQFDAEGNFITPIGVTAPDGAFYRDYFKNPVSVVGFSQPPQITANGPDHFIVAMTGQEASIKVQIIDFVETEGGSFYVPRPLALEDEDAAGFLYTPERFQEPAGLCLTGDGTNYIFVVDAMKDSFYQFSTNGLEGVKPPVGAAETSLQVASFGGRGTSLTQFNRPTAVAYKDRIVYVADSENGRVLRFKLTIDFE
jgi:hypothetical protein